jgi:shikimate kinase
MVVVLVGFMGAGKTTVGRIIAERLGQPFVDSDVLIEQRIGREIRDVFATEGEAYFRELKHATVADLVRGPEAVVALGGGAVEDLRTRAVLRNARVVYLRVILGSGRPAPACTSSHRPADRRSVQPCRAATAATRAVRIASTGPR